MNAKTCYHCGDSIDGIAIQKADKDFCCIGCKSVYTLLNEHHLGDFYTYEKAPGLKPNAPLHDKYKFLELDEISKRFITYEDDEIIKIMDKRSALPEMLGDHHFDGLVGVVG